MQEVKAPWQSKTLVLNAIFGLVAAISLFVPAASAITDYLKSHVEIVAMVWSALNMILRFVTKDKIGLGE